MNVAQRLVLAAGLVVIASIFYVPYSVDKSLLLQDYYSPNGSYIRYSNDSYMPIMFWTEFYSSFAPPQLVDDRGDVWLWTQRNEEGEIVYYPEQPKGESSHQPYHVVISRKRDWVLHGSIIAGEVLMLALLFLVFKTKRLKN